MSAERRSRIGSNVKLGNARHLTQQGTARRHPKCAAGFPIRRTARRSKSAPDQEPETHVITAAQSGPRMSLLTLFDEHTKPLGTLSPKPNGFVFTFQTSPPGHSCNSLGKTVRRGRASDAPFRICRASGRQRHNAPTPSPW